MKRAVLALLAADIWLRIAIKLELASRYEHGFMLGIAGLLLAVAYIACFVVDDGSKCSSERPI